MLEAARSGLRRVRRAAHTGMLAARIAYRTKLLAGLRPAGVAAFLRALPGERLGAHLALKLHACNQPDNIAMIDGDRQISWAELDQQVQALAHALIGTGVAPGDRVAIMMHNCIEYTLVQQAAVTIGSTLVQVGYRLKEKEVGYILGNSSPRVIVYQRDYHELIGRALVDAAMTGAIARVVTGRDSEALDDGERLEDFIAPHLRLPGDRGPSAPASSAGGVMINTSGTTGAPKGATRTVVDTSLVPALDFFHRIGITATERHLIVCPLYHSGATAFDAMTFYLGGTVLLLERFDPEEVLATIARARVTSIFLVPTMIAQLTDLPAATRARHDCTSLRWVCSGAAPLPTETARRFRETFGSILWNFYGSTETGLVSLAGPADHEARPGTVGTLLAGNHIRILDDAGKECGPDEIGELWVRNDMLVSGYHANPAATAEAKRAGYFSVGDLARVDGDGYLYMASRKSDMVISGGVNIYPREIENHIMSLPQVRECAVVGVPDEQWGESLRAYVVPREGETISPDEIAASCREALAGFKCPRKIELIDELPRNPTGKVLKRKLRELALASDGAP